MACDRVLNLVWIFLSVLICVKSWALTLWVPAGPGGGLLPFIAGAIIGVIGLCQLVSASLDSANPRRKGEKFWPTVRCRTRIVAVITGFCAMAYFLEKVGFLVASVVITVFLMRVIKRQTLLKAMCIAVCSCASVYVLFEIVMQMNLPRSMFGF